MTYMLVCYMDDDSVVVRYSETDIFGPPFTAEEAGTIVSVRLYRRVDESHRWEPVKEWGHMCADEQWDVIYARENA